MFLLLLGTWILDKANLINTGLLMKREKRNNSEESNALIEDYPSQITGGIFANREFILHFRHVFTIQS